MDKSPLVSVLIPNYNKSLYLSETLDSVIAQTYPHWECIIVDDHSTDNSWEILESYSKKESRIKILKRPENRRKGGNAARNYAFELSSGEYVNWLDSDDRLNTIFSEEKIKSFAKDCNLDFVLSDIYSFDDDVFLGLPIYDYDKRDINPLDFGNSNFVFQTSMPLYKRSFLSSLPYLFDENLMVMQDVEFHVRVVLKSSNFQINKNSVIFWRGVIGSKTNQYQSDDYALKYQKSYPAYKSIFLQMRSNKKKMTENQIRFFKNVFNDMLFFLPISHRYFWDLFFFGVAQDVFKGRFQGVKILAIRCLKILKLT